MHRDGIGVVASYGLLLGGKNPEGGAPIYQQFCRKRKEGGKIFLKVLFLYYK